MLVHTEPPVGVARNEAVLSVGYSPFLNFDVKDMDQKVYRMVQLGGKVR
jgi:hypothetical protein